MSWEDEALRSRYTTDFYEVILAGLSSDDIDDQIEALQSLSDTLAYGNEGLLSEFPIVEVCGLVTELLKSPTPLVYEGASLCTFQVLEAHPGSTRALIGAGALDQMKQMMTRLHSVTVAENLIRAADIVSQFRPGNLAESVGIAPILGCFEFSTVMVQRSIMKTICQMTEQMFYESFTESLMKIAELMGNPDEKVADYAMRSCCQIGNRADSDDFPFTAIPLICRQLNHMTDHRKMQRLVYLLSRLTTNNELGEHVIGSELDFEKLLFAAESSQAKSDVVRHAMSITLNLLPSAPIETNMLRRKDGAPQSAKQFAVYIQPMLIRALVEHIEFEHMAMSALASTLDLNSIELPQELVNVLCGLTQQPSLSPFVLLLTLTMNPDVVAKSGILGLLKSSAVSDEDEWYHSHLTELCNKVGNKAKVESIQLSQLSSLREILTCIKEKDIGAFEPLQDGFFSRVMSLSNDFPSFDRQLIEPFVDKLMELLVFLPLPKVNDPYNGNFTSLKSNSITVRVAHGDDVSSYSYNPLDSMIGVESFWNYEGEKVSDDMLRTAWRRSGRIGEIIQVPTNLSDMTHGEVGILHRIMKTRQYQRMEVRLDDLEASPKDMIFKFMESKQPDHEMRQRWTFHVSETEKDDEFKEMSKLDVPTMAIDPKMLGVLNLLRKIHETLPDLPMTCEMLDKRLSQGLNSAYCMLAHSSPQVQIIVNFPFLFSFDTRSYLMRIISSDMLHSLQLAFTRQRGGKLESGHNLLKCQIRRDRLFDDGMLLMKTVGVSQFGFEISYQGEEGIGVGPTAEFFSLFARELSRKSRGLWRNDFKNESDFAYHEKGLFPIVTADQQLFFVLGVLCAKAITMGFIVPLPFNNAFFKLVKAEEVTLDEVEPSLSSGLKSYDGLADLPFVYPGTSLPMKENGENIEVTADNFEEYKRLVIDHTLGSKLNPIIESFRKGFANVMQRGCWDMVSASELSSMISGDEVCKVTMKELVESTELSNGYSLTSPQVQMFFESLVEMDSKHRQLFFKFVTGSERLPIGGLAMLQPKLTIARKVGCGDDSLPSVMTCTNYFKLPPYDTKDELLRKLFMAIEEGQEIFSLT